MMDSGNGVCKRIVIEHEDTRMADGIDQASVVGYSDSATVTR